MRLNTNTAKSRLNEKHYQKELFKYKLKHWFESMNTLRLANYIDVGLTEVKEDGVIECAMDRYADSLFEYAKDPEVGPIAGWPPHRSREESLDVIRNVLNGRECYAICEKGNPKAIGAIELILNRHNDTENHDEECELGYWLGKPFWGRGYMPEAAREMIRHGFEDLGMNTIWCGYFEGNQKSKRVQEKIGFVYHHTREKVSVPLMKEVRTEHRNIMTKERWMAEREKNCGKV